MPSADDLDVPAAAVRAVLHVQIRQAVEQGGAAASVTPAHRHPASSRRLRAAAATSKEASAGPRGPCRDAGQKRAAPHRGAPASVSASP